MEQTREKTENKRGEEEERLPVTYEGKWIYDILLESSYDGILEELERIGYKKNIKICIVTDSNVQKVYEETLKSHLLERFDTVKTFVFEAGEKSKTLDTIQKLYEYLIINKFERGDLLLALGGGVVGDMTGYAAATYLRGIDFIQIPTTLLAQVDSSVGGKTGVDFAQYKNMVGAFKQPRLVYINLNVLKSLPEKQFASGMAEALKSGWIQDREYSLFLEKYQKEIQSISYEQIRNTVSGSCRIKRDVVQKDPLEHGERALLNFGHTIGHAIEKLSDFSLYHGECVALGMVAAAQISWKKGNIEKKDLERIEQMLLSYHLPIHLDVELKQKINAKDILSATKSDKKMENGQIKFVLLQEIGKAYLSRDISDEMLLDGIHYILD
ncbi:MAG: 3-dehydroquinate synthase [Lachnospiraceae bacterium]|nr:3-dehydroquinate synthase [Lachnospiraceae bacterium]